MNERCTIVTILRVLGINVYNSSRIYLHQKSRIVKVIQGYISISNYHTVDNEDVLPSNIIIQGQIQDFGKGSPGNC